MVSPRPYATIFFESPGESRNACASNSGAAFALARDVEVSTPQLWHAAGPPGVYQSEQYWPPAGQAGYRLSFIFHPGRDGWPTRTPTAALGPSESTGCA